MVCILSNNSGMTHCPNTCMLKSGQLMQCRWPKFRFENFVIVINAQFKQERRKGLQKIVWLSGLHFGQETNKKSCCTYIHHVNSQNILSNHKKEFIWQSVFGQMISSGQLLFAALKKILGAWGHAQGLKESPVQMGGRGQGTAVLCEKTCFSI